MDYVPVAEKILKHVINNGLEGRVDELVSSDLDEQSLLASLSEVFTEIEQSLGRTALIDDIAKAILSVLSGKILLKAKQLIGHGKWRFYAMEHFDMNEHERNIRMKAASIIGIENYFFLGWKRISALTQATKRSKQPDPFKEIVKNISYTIDPYHPDDFEHFNTLVNGYIIWANKIGNLKNKIKFEQIVDAVECEVEFDGAFIKRLEKSNNPAVSLYNYIDFETVKATTHCTRNVKSKRRELATLINKLSFVGSMVIENADDYLKKVTIDSLDKCAGVVNKLLDMKRTELGV
ncbi:hypothetical protein [Maridesulfovibrio sp.]|uniref:hypothetical protein n=1 Tax=Maridesulfovibrio sp. TaxID=2795000 RepID=UPI002AA74D06|nr:hypothetical protein [Maridesulfovibrio sp.]